MGNQRLYLLQSYERRQTLRYFLHSSRLQTLQPIDELQHHEDRFVDLLCLDQLVFLRGETLSSMQALSIAVDCVHLSVCKDYYGG